MNSNKFVRKKRNVAARLLRTQHHNVVSLLEKKYFSNTEKLWQRKDQKAHVGVGLLVHKKYKYIDDEEKAGFFDNFT